MEKTDTVIKSAKREQNQQDDLKYMIVGRYMDGTRVVGYHLKLSNGTHRRYSREALAFLVAKGVVLNCSGRIEESNGGSIQFCGKNGTVLTDLPIQKVSELPKKKKEFNEESHQHMEKVLKSEEAKVAITHLVCHDDDSRVILGYIVKNANNHQQYVDRQSIKKIAACGLILNARVQKANGKVILRSSDDNAKLTDLPKVKYSKITGKKPPELKSKPDIGKTA